jgi:hypothetical protein
MIVTVNQNQMRKGRLAILFILALHFSYYLQKNSRTNVFDDCSTENGDLNYK